MLTERIKPIIAVVSPMKVIVTCETIEDSYFIHFDGSETVKIDPNFWATFWGGFDKYVKFILLAHHFTNVTIENTSDTHIVAGVGTLFDFLKADHE